MKKNWKRLLCGVLAAAMLVVFVPACTDKGASGKDVELLVDLHGWMPSSSNSTTAGSQPYTATQELADEFMDLNPNIKIKWASTKPLGTQDELAQWFTTQINGGTCPAVAFSWGTAFSDRNWYADLDSYLDEPNEYEPGNAKWRDSFEDYLWSLNSISDPKGDVVAIPLVLYPGSATGYYYNKTLLDDYNVKESDLLTWSSFEKTVAKLKSDAKSAVAFAPTADIKVIQFSSWPLQFSIGPSYAQKMTGALDADKDGNLSVKETLKGVLDGAFNPETYEGAKELLARLYDYYNVVAEKGWDSSDYETKWKAGNVAVKEAGLWAYNTEASTVHENDYKWDVVPSPMLTSADAKDRNGNKSPYVADIEFKEGVSNPTPDLQVNVMKSAVEGKPEVMDAAVKFLKFLTSKDRNEYMVGAKDSGLPAVIGAENPPTIADSGFLEKTFPVRPNASWPAAYTSEYNARLDTLFKNWVNNASVDPWDYEAKANQDFYKAFNEIQLAGARDYVKKLGLEM